MSLYPSLEDMKVDMMMRAQVSLVTEASAQPKQIQGAPSYPQPTALQGLALYPALGNYMGLELSSEEIALNMPEYQLQIPTTAMGQIAPITSQSLTFEKSAVKQGIRPVVLCKDKDGKVGLRLRSISDGVFVCYVADGSPAALGGLRFGDQVLEINGVTLAGMSMEKAHDILKKAPVNGIALIVRDRPFERTLTLHRDSVGCYGFKLSDGCIVSLVQGSSAARNGLLTDHQLLEVDSRNVVGLKDKEVAALLRASPAVINITVVPIFIYKHMIKKMSTSLLRESMDRTPAV